MMFLLSGLGSARQGLSLQEIVRNGHSTNNFASSAMEERNSRVSGSLLKGLIFEGRTEVFTVQGEREDTSVLIKEAAKDTFLLKSLSVLGAAGVATVSELSETIEGISELVVTESRVICEVSLEGNTNLELVVSSLISMDFPIVNTTVKGLNKGDNIN